MLTYVFTIVLIEEQILHVSTSIFYNKNNNPVTNNNNNNKRKFVLEVAFKNKILKNSFL